VLLVKPNADGGADVVGTLNEANDALINALIQRMAKAQVVIAMADKELGAQTQRESSDLLAATNDTQINKVVNG
jgi:hypothetical protein